MVSMVRKLLLVFPLALLAACTEPSATLVVVLDALPATTSRTTIGISGIVERTPPKATTFIITVSGGIQVVADTADATGRFTAAVRLNLNAANDLVVTAEDAGGSVSQPVTITLRHDNEPPTVVASTPSGDGAAPTANVEVTFSEPVVFEPRTALRLFHQGEELPGVTTASTDRTQLTFLPSVAMWENAIYRIQLEEVRDDAGNEASLPSSPLCFVTTAPTATTHVAAEPTNDLWTLGQPIGISPADLTQLRLAAHSGGLFGVYRFTTPRGWGDAQANHAFTYLELDIDQDPGTGFLALRDYFFETNPSLQSGMGAEYVVALDWVFSSVGIADSAVVGHYVAELEFEVLDVLYPDLCDEFQGFSVPTSLFGGDDGRFDYSVVAGNAEATGLLLDPAPESGVLTADFSGEFAPHAVSPAPGAAGRPRIIVRPRRR